jgi:hypothetical protein
LAIDTGILSLLPAIHVSGNLSLNATNGAINQGAPLSVGNTLTGSSSGNVTLLNAGNQINTLGSFSAPSFSLVNSQALTINGPVSTALPGTLAVNALGALNVNAALAGGAVNLTAASVTLASSVTTTMSLSVTANSGAIVQSSGTLTSPASCTFDAGANTITLAHDVSCATAAFTAATLNLNGALDFGASIDTSVIATVTGNYSQTGALALRAFATSSHELAVSGSAALGGKLIVNFASVPAIGQNLTVLTAASVSGTFAALEVTGLPNDRVAEISYTASSVVLTIRAAVTCFVKFDAAGVHDGSSWVDAYTDLQSALLNTGCEQIWVARGVYTPTTTTDRSIAFRLTAHLLGVYGGFGGSEAQLAQRDVAANLTVLSGDIDSNDTGSNGVDADAGDIVGNNSYHVIVMDGTAPAGPITASAVLDGFTITGGQAEGDASDSSGGGLYCDGSGAGHACSPTLSNLHFAGNESGTNGGGLYLDGSGGGDSSPLVANTTFSGNASANGGGAFHEAGATGGRVSPTYINDTFSGNRGFYGGAIYHHVSSGTGTLSLTNVSVSNNHADAGGGALAEYSCGGAPTVNITNTIFWADTGPAGSEEMVVICDTPVFTNSVVQGSGGSGAGWQTAFGTDGGGNLDADPKLGPLQDNGGSTPTLMLAAGSSAIDAGLDSACNAAPVYAHDQRGIVRPIGAHCDIGAVEATHLILNVTDGVAFGFYGNTLQYIVTLQNQSATDTISGVHLGGLGTAALDGPNTLWFCTIGNCTTTQTQGPFSDVATLVPSGTLTWLVNVPVLQNSTAATATMTIRSNVAGAVTDTDTLAIFRGTFDGP